MGSGGDREGGTGNPPRRVEYQTLDRLVTREQSGERSDLTHSRTGRGVTPVFRVGPVLGGDHTQTRRSHFWGRGGYLGSVDCGRRVDWRRQDRCRLPLRNRIPVQSGTDHPLEGSLGLGLPPFVYFSSLGPSCRLWKTNTQGSGTEKSSSCH